MLSTVYSKPKTVLELKGMSAYIYQEFTVEQNVRCAHSPHTQGQYVSKKFALPFNFSKLIHTVSCSGVHESKFTDFTLEI